MSFSKKEASENCFHLIKEHFENEWKHVQIEDMQIDRVFGGCTGYLFRCQAANAEPGPLLIRFNRDDDGDANPYSLKFVGDAAELLIFYLLSKNNFGPKLYSIFRGGRIEEYIESDQLSTEDVNTGRYDNVIVQKIAFFHSLDMPIIKNDSWIRRIFSLYYKKLSSLPKKQEKAGDVCLIVNQILEFDLIGELQWMESCSDLIGSKHVFSHNDITKRNILIRKDCDDDNERVVIIDFGDCYYNHRAFDLADFLRCKSSNYSLNMDEYKKFIHSDENILQLLRNYLAAYQDQKKDQVWTEQDVEQLAYEVHFFLLLSDLMTILYITLSTEKPIPCLDSWKYGLERIRLYKWTKQSFFAKYEQKVPFGPDLV